MQHRQSLPVETPYRIEPALIEQPGTTLVDRIAELSAQTARLEARLRPATAASLAHLVRMMNCYYSNLIEGHDTRPLDIERALEAPERKPLLLEARAHVRVQRQIDSLASSAALPEPASVDFVRWLHREFYRDADPSQLNVGGRFQMVPGEFRSQKEHDVAVGRHVPPSSTHVAEFMRYFETRYRFENLGTSQRILALACAHHRFNFIHPFPDGNGRVSRLMSHAMGWWAGIAAHGLWSVSRGLARGMSSRSEYKAMMDLADGPREGDLDGRGNLSQRRLDQFVEWFLTVCLDQVIFMSGLFDLDSLGERLERYARELRLPAGAGPLLRETLIRGELARGEAARVIGKGERMGRSVLGKVIARGLLGSATPKGPVSLRFSVESSEVLFPRLFPQA